MSDEEPMNPDHFLGDYDGYMAWLEEHPPPFNPYFCSHHWAPCPVEGKPGLLMTVILTSEAFAFMPSHLKTADDWNGWLRDLTEPICCKLGDEKMTWLWNFLEAPHCGAGGGDKLDIRKPKGRRACWFAPDHDGPHEWELPVQSIFVLMEGT